MTLFYNPPDHVSALELHMPMLSLVVVLFEGVVLALWDSPKEHRSKAQFALL